MGEISTKRLDRISAQQAQHQSEGLSCTAQQGFHPIHHYAGNQLQTAFLDFNMDGLYNTKAADHCGTGMGTVIDYAPRELRQDQSFALGLAYEEKLDLRSPGEKLQQFIAAAAKNASDVHNYQQYIDGELDKLVGVGEGLNTAKEQTKAAGTAALKALTDGTAAKILSKPNVINDALFGAVGKAVDVMAKDPYALNKSLEALGTTITQASEHYSMLPNREKGHVIGETMFALVNPEGSTKSGEAALQVVGTMATHVDNCVMQTIEQSIRAIDEMAKTAPDVAEIFSNVVF